MYNNNFCEWGDKSDNNNNSYNSDNSDNSDNRRNGGKCENMTTVTSIKTVTTVETVTTVTTETTVETVKTVTTVPTMINGDNSDDIWNGANSYNGNHSGNDSVTFEQLPPLQQMPQGVLHIIYSMHPYQDTLVLDTLVIDWLIPRSSCPRLEEEGQYRTACAPGLRFHTLHYRRSNCSSLNILHQLKQK